MESITGRVQDLTMGISVERHWSKATINARWQVDDHLIHQGYQNSHDYAHLCVACDALFLSHSYFTEELHTHSELLNDIPFIAICDRPLACWSYCIFIMHMSLLKYKGVSISIHKYTYP